MRGGRNHPQSTRQGTHTLDGEVYHAGQGTDRPAAISLDACSWRSKPEVFVGAS